jgi:hypothetical protein
MTFRVVHIRKKYACKTCEETIRTAPMPKQPIPQSIAAPGLLAAIINSKFNHHMPLYRQETIFSDAGVPVTRATLSQWMIKSAHLLRPLVKLMEANIQEHDVAYSDETTLQVLNEKDRLPTQKSYMWLFIGGPPDKRAFVYQYHPTRSHGIAADFFADFKGYLHADCYKAYIELGLLGRIKHVACWEHARRYFVDVVKQGPRKQGLANQIIALVAKLYFLEKTLVHTYRQLPDHTPVEVFKDRARLRKAAILNHCWDAEQGFFFDFNHSTYYLSLNKATFSYSYICLFN